MLARVLRRIGTLRRAFSPKSLILMYHRIDDPPADPWGVCVEPEVFRQQMEVLAECNAACRLKDVQERSGRVAVTFDDGYADNFYRALPLLRELNIPATFFVVAGSAGQPAFWWDELQRIVLHAACLPGAPLHLRIGHEQFRGVIAPEDIEWSPQMAGSFRSWIAWRHRPPTSRHALFVAVWNALRKVDEGERRKHLDAIAAWAGHSGSLSEDVRPMTNEELRLVAREELIELGGHSVKHSRLSALPPDEQAAEIDGSFRFLNELTGLPPESFAFPFGNSGDYTPRTVALVERAGFARSCTTINQGIYRTSNRFTLPRVHVENWPREYFANWLRRELRCGQDPEVWHQ